MIAKFCEACYSVKWMVQISNINALKLIYFAHFHFIIKYGFGVTFPTVGSYHFINENHQNYGLCSTHNLI